MSLLLEMAGMERNYRSPIEDDFVTIINSLCCRDPAVFDRILTLADEMDILAEAVLAISCEPQKYVLRNGGRLSERCFSTLGCKETRFEFYCRGKLYEKGIGVPVDLQLAAQHYEWGAYQECPLSQSSLGYCNMLLGKDPEQAIIMSRVAAEQGNAVSQFYLGRCLEIAGQLEESVEAYKAAVQQGLPEAMCSLGSCYEFGRGVTADEEQAFQFYLAGAKLGDSQAQCSAGLFYEQGKGTQTDFENAVYWFCQAAANHNPTGHNYLGRCHQLGQGTSCNIELAVHHYRLSFNLGLKEAEDNLVVCYAEHDQFHPRDEAVRLHALATKMGLVVAQTRHSPLEDEFTSIINRLSCRDPIMLERIMLLVDETKDPLAEALLAIGYFTQDYVQKKDVERGIALANKCFSWLLRRETRCSYFCLGKVYEQGIGLPVDGERGAHYFRLGSELDCPVCQSALGYYFTKKDPQEAMRLLKLVAEQDQDYATGIYYFGCCLEAAGQLQEAVEVYQVAATHGNPNAMRDLAACYEFGRGVEVDEHRAFQLYHASAHLGDSQAQSSVGSCYQQGRVVRQDYIDAFHWFSLSAANEDPNGIYSLGLCFELSWGTPPNVEMAFRCYLLTSNMGLGAAHYRLAACYESGCGVAQNLFAAISHYSIASDYGIPSAQREVDRIVASFYGHLC